MRASTKRILSIGFAGLLFIGTLIVYGNFIEPEMAVVSEKRAQVYSKERAFNERKEAVEKVQALVAKLKGSAQLQETVNLAFPAKPNVTQVLGQLNAIARTNQVNLNSFSIKPQAFQVGTKSIVKRIGVMEMELSVSGPYEAIRNFGRALETNIRVVNIKNLKIEPLVAGGEGARSGFSALKGSLTVEVYYQE